MSRSAGFTLIEVLVALAISALGLGALIAAIGTGVANSRIADQYIEAVRRAQSRLAELGVTIPLTPGERSGDDGNGYRWRVRVVAEAVHPGAAQTADQPRLALYAIDTTISWQSAGSVRNLSVHTERLGRAADGT